MAQLLIESSGAPQKIGNFWRAVLITPGKGSSGIYTEETLRNSGPMAFTKGTHSYVDHPRNEVDIRSPKNLIGVLAEDARYEEGVGLVAELEIMPHWKEFVEAVAPHTGLSIYAMGEGGYNDDGDVVVEALVPNTQNSVDLVSYPGRPGSKLADKLYEAAVAMVTEAEPGSLKVGDYVSWNSSGGRARGRVERIVRDGSINVPDSDFMVDGTEDNPAALIRLYRDNGRTDTMVGHRFSTLTKISDIGESLPSNYRPATSSNVPEGGSYCNAWAPKQQEASALLSGKNGTAAQAAAATESNKEEGNSDMELKELSDQIAELPNLVAAAVAEALAPVEETEEKEEVDVAAVAEAMVAADLPEVSRKAVYESLRAGGDLAEAIESQKAFVESVKTHFKEQADASPRGEETVIFNTAEKAPRLSEILNVKVGA